MLLRSTPTILPPSIDCETDAPGTSACREKDSNLRRRMPADLQSASFGRSDIPAHTETARSDTHGSGEANLSCALAQCPMAELGVHEVSNSATRCYSNALADAHRHVLETLDALLDRRMSAEQSGNAPPTHCLERVVDEELTRRLVDTHRDPCGSG